MLTNFKQAAQSDNVEYRTWDLEKLLKPRPETEIRREIEMKAKDRFTPLRKE
jgi:hypothetical protein